MKHVTSESAPSWLSRGALVGQMLHRGDTEMASRLGMS